MSPSILILQRKMLVMTHVLLEIQFQYGGDVTRRMKLLRNQAEGKKKMRSVANINVPKDAFITLLRK